MTAPKRNRPAKNITLSPEGHRLLERAALALGVSQSAVVDLLLRQWRDRTEASR